MARMMDIGRPTTPPKKEESQNPIPEPKHDLEMGFSDSKVTTTNKAMTNPDKTDEPDQPRDHEVELPAQKSEEVTTAAPIKPREISSYALPDDSEAKTFPLAPVLAVIGIVIVLGVVYLLVFV